MRSPGHSHERVAQIHAPRAGKHVFTEYPLGAYLKEAQDMTALARKMGVKTMVGLQDALLPYYV